MTEPEQTQRRPRALVVEDDPAIRRLVEKILTRHQIDADLASDGRTAIENLRSRDYEVLILDLMVPEVNGFQVIDYLRRSGKVLPVAVVSAVSQQALQQLDFAVVKLVIGKPFDVEELTRGILSLVRPAPDPGDASQPLPG
jgi:DNA-binding response OmpR family regulator